MIDFIESLLGGLPDWAERPLMALIAALIGLTLAFVAHALLFRGLHRIAHRSASEADDIVVNRLNRPSRWAFLAMGVVLAARETPALEAVWERFAPFIMPLLTGWVAVAVLRAFVEAMMVRADISVENNRNARRRRTRLSIFSRIGTFLIVFLTVSGMLASVPGVREIGVTLMASAGLAALAVGAAAQPALKALIAGFQMAMTEPISIDDVIILDGEWGRIEDIRTTYVVVRLWDERRLVVPSNRFLEDTFQNWTKTTSQLLGTVFLYLDQGTDIGPIREEYTRQITSHRLWDRRAQVLQVTDCKDSAIEVRLLMSAKDGPTLFDLRCELREGMMDWIRRNQPEALVRRRTLPVAPVELEATAGLAELVTASANGQIGRAN
ncbi:MAG: mechanosensitive ion channel family protein [Novosphingobium lindaniclasticum]|jgi:small-conductance mechanosensitive channel|uniref:mechanosensitive ion channel family protein n=1 Tax=Novosphingobium lindaniclasticum TaxID=1329895 RepID=UPI00240A9C1F|nr:mechanosensitive ion channel domain-containing protein [Novosphingobium lindaniclasticum]MDF2637631.1 mechanosensitive ion channel family protein [Novosphingobium lindaniclasticum]